MRMRATPVLLGFALALCVRSGVAQQGERMAGEYGLWVREVEGRLEVRWITERADSGFLRVLERGRVRQEFRTPAALVHAVAFRPPRGADLVLQYGALDSPDDRHETAIRRDRNRRDPPAFGAVDSLFVMGDVHGEFDRFTRLLRNAGLVDERLRWTGGRSHLALLGDLMDRGPDVIRTLWYLYGLEREAARAGGRVHVLLGNHEIMVFTHDLRYVSPKEMRIAELYGVKYSRMFDIRHSILGRWLAAKPALVRIGSTLLAHGGVTSDHLGYSVEAFDDSLATFMGEELFYRWADTSFVVALDSAALARRNDFFWGENSVFWHRGYVYSDTLGEALARVLRRFRSDLLVVGHTPQARIVQRYGGRLIAVHPPAPAQEMLLLVRSGRARRAFRVGPEGGAQPLVPVGDGGAQPIREPELPPASQPDAR